MPNKNSIKLFKNSENSKQINNDSEELFWQKEGIIEPSFDFDVLLYTYDNSAIISWISK